REQFEETYGAAKDDMDKVAAFADAHGLAVVDESLARRTIVLRGTVAQVNAAFGVDLGVYKTKTETYRGREGAIAVPDALAGVVEGVFGLDDRKMAAPLLKIARPSPAAAAAAATSGTRAVTPPEVAKLYNFPNRSAAGQTIGIIEFGGGFW